VDVEGRKNSNADSAKLKMFIERSAILVLSLKDEGLNEKPDIINARLAPDIFVATFPVRCRAPGSRGPRK
jgi:hypothetical protein